jgi:hypothetical protein
MRERENFSGYDPTAPDILRLLSYQHELWNFIDGTTAQERRVFLRRIPELETMLAVAALIEAGEAQWVPPRLTKQQFGEWVTRLVERCPEVCDIVVYAVPLYRHGHPISRWEVELWLADDGLPEAPAVERFWQRMRADPYLRFDQDQLALFVSGCRPVDENSAEQADVPPDYITYTTPDGGVHLVDVAAAERNARMRSRCTEPPSQYEPYQYRPQPPIREWDPVEAKILRHYGMLHPLAQPRWHRTERELGGGRLIYCRRAAGSN